MNSEALVNNHRAVSIQQNPSAPYFLSRFTV